MTPHVPTLADTAPVPEGPAHVTGDWLTDPAYVETWWDVAEWAEDRRRQDDVYRALWVHVCEMIFRAQSPDHEGRPASYYEGGVK